MVGPWERLGWLGYFIKMNPVRREICLASDLGDFALAAKLRCERAPRAAEGEPDLAISIFGLNGRIARLLISIALAALAASSPLSGAGDERPWLTVSNWRTTEGLPQNSVNALAQTPDGYIWIGTYGGLARFDGRQMEVFNRHSQLSLPSNSIVALHVDDRGILWLATENGDLFTYERGGFTRFANTTDRTDARIMAISSDARGDVWLLDREGKVVRTRDGATFAAPPREREPRGPTTFARDAASGELHLLHLGLVLRVEDDGLRELQVGLERTNDVGMIGADIAEGIWIATQNGLERLLGDGKVAERRPLPFTGGGLTGLVGMRDGTLALSTVDSGVFLCGANGGVRRSDAKSALDDNWVRCLLLDRSQTLWVGTSTAGLAAIQSSGIQLVSPPQEWGLRPIKSVTPSSKGGVWAGSEGVGLLHFNDGIWTKYGTDLGLSNPFVWSVHEDRTGRVWTATWGGGLFAFDGSSFARLPNLPDPTASISSILPARDGSHWIGTTQGLWRCRPSGEVERYPTLQGPSAGEVRTLAEGPDGSLWFAPSSGGLNRWVAGQIEVVELPPQPARLIISSLHIDERGVVWFGALSEGLFRFEDGKLFAYGAAFGINEDTVTHIEADDPYLWVSTTRAIQRVARDELDAVALGRAASVAVKTFGDGTDAAATPRASGARPTGCRTADGTIWFATSDGLVRLDPAFERESEPPQPLLEQIVIDGDVYPLIGGIGESQVLIVPAGSERVEFRFTAPEFLAPDALRFRYRIKLDDSAWIEAGRARTANYHRLPPGDYVFELEVSNGPLVRRLEQAFVVQPLFLQRASVRVAGYLLAALAIVGLVSLRARAVHRRREGELRRQQALDRERTRIARDIHDDLGASLTRINLMTQAARRELARPAEAAQRLEQIARTARTLTHKMDEIVWAVSPRHDSLESVAHYLASFAQDHLADAGISCRLDIPVVLKDRAVYAESRHHLFLAFQEAIHNVIKHSGAARVLVTLRPGSKSFIVTVEDNGSGIALRSDQPPRRNGLDNMHRRLAEVGGKCKIAPAAGGGTGVLFEVPYDRPCTRNSS